MNSQDQCADAIKEAVEYLDTHIPDWANRIDLSEFNFIDSSSCISGQLNIDPDVCKGFDSPLESGDDNLMWSYDFMGLAWREIVTLRQAKCV